MKILLTINIKDKDEKLLHFNSIQQYSIYYYRKYNIYLTSRKSLESNVQNIKYRLEFKYN